MLPRPNGQRRLAGECHFNEPQQFGGTVYLVCELEANHPTIMRLALISDSNELELGVREWRGEIQVGVSLNRLEASQFEVSSGLPDLDRVISVCFGERSSDIRLRTAGMLMRPDGDTLRIF